MTALIDEYENYTKEMADPGNLAILQHIVWEKDAELSAMSEIYGLVKTKNSGILDFEEKLEQIERMLCDAKKNLTKIKDRHKR